ncbi:MAG: hypothetical protein R2847_10170 [Bacteroidia bacterium]
MNKLLRFLKDQLVDAQMDIYLDPFDPGDRASTHEWHCRINH